MAVLTVNAINKTGITDVGAQLAAAAGGGDSFPNTGKEFLYVNNGGGGSITVTISSNGAGTVCNFGVTGTQHDKTLTVGAGKIGVIGGLDPKQFNDSNGRVQVTYSGVSSVTVGAFALPPAG